MNGLVVNFSSTSREFVFTKTDFEIIRQIIYEHAGINLSVGKQDLVYSRLARRLRANGLKTFSDYITLIEDRNGEEWQTFVNALTTNLTSFFREPHHFPVLADHVAKLKHRRPIQIWCNAASTGEEPYTIAMTMIDLFESETPPVNILATDIDTNALKKASSGIYTLEQVSKLPKDKLQRFFLKGRGEKAGHVKVHPSLSNLITFRQLNLIEQKWPINGLFDAIFCRNVMIYFDKPTQARILRRFVPLMHNDGLLFAGHSESLHISSDIFRLRGKTVYELTEKIPIFNPSKTNKY